MVADWESSEKRSDLGHRLQEFREQAGLTQQQLSELAGCSKNYLSAVERGINKLTVPVLLEYCNATHKSPNEVLGYGTTEANDELVSIVSSLTKEQYDQAVKMLKALL